MQQSLVAVAGVAAAEESWDEAVRLIGATDSLGAEPGSVLPLWDRVVADADLGKARTSLPAAFEAAYEEGRSLTADEAVAYAERGRGERKRPSSGWAGLTPMERQVVGLVAEGLRNTDIATRLFVAPSQALWPTQPPSYLGASCERKFRGSCPLCNCVSAW